MFDCVDINGVGESLGIDGTYFGAFFIIEPNSCDFPVGVLGVGWSVLFCGIRTFSTSKKIDIRFQRSRIFWAP